MEIIKEHFPTNSRYLDVGANVGNHAIFLGKFLNPQQITLIEPNPEAATLLPLNLLRNKLLEVSNLDFVHLGLSDQPSAGASVIASNRNLGGGKVIDDGSGNIDIVRGDDLFSGMSFDFVKIAAEGMELKVLQGMKRVIKTTKPTIFIEVDSVNQSAFESWLERESYIIHDRYRRYKANINYLIKPIA